MAGGPANWNRISEPGKVNVDVRGGGVHTGAILEGNRFHGNVTNRISCTGPPTRDGAGPVAPREHNGDGTISIKNDGSQTHQLIARNNEFHGDMVNEQNFNIHEGDEDQMDLR